MALIEEADGRSALAVGVGKITAALVVEGDERALGAGDLERQAVLEPDVEGQEADAAAGELGDGLTRRRGEDAIEARLAHRVDGAVVVEVDVSEADGHLPCQYQGAESASRGGRRCPTGEPARVSALDPAPI